MDVSDTYYGLATSEQLRHQDVDSFVESYLDEIEPRFWPDTIEVVKWERQKLDGGCFQDLDDLYEMLDEEHGDPDASPSVPSKNVQECWETFVRAVKDDYFVWVCEPTDEVTKVDVKKWVQEKRPDWLDEADVRERFS
jgi:hypothetical protein